MKFNYKPFFEIVLKATDNIYLVVLFLIKQLLSKHE